MSSFQNASDSEAYVLAAAASGVEEFLTCQGGDMDRIAGRAGLSTAQFAMPTNELSLAAYCRLFREAEVDTQDGNIGLHFGQQFQPHQLGLIGYIALCSKTVEQAVRNLASYFGYHQTGTITRLIERDDAFRLEYMITDPAIQERRHDAELTMGMFSNILRMGMGQQWSPRNVLFAHEQPEQADEHRTFFQADICFSAGTNALVFSRGDLGRIMPGSDANLLQIMKSSLVALARGEGAGSAKREPALKGQVMDEIRFTLGQGGGNFAEIAARLSISSWTLQRQLSQLGLSYSALLDEVRQKEALRLFHDSGMSISEIATRLGYTETSAFSRAFRRWLGVSPRVWRQQNRLLS